MGKTPAGFKRFSAALDEMARARLCECNGSEQLFAVGEEGTVELPDLMDSFLERGCGCGGEEERRHEDRESEDGRGDEESASSDFDTRKVLVSLICGEADGRDGSARRVICTEIEAAYRSFGSESPVVFKRRLMSWLQQRGYDAGLCKARWQKTAQSPAGEHDYVDIIIARARYIVEISPTTQFTLARPTDPYASLLELFPPILVCEEETLKAVVRLMCTAMRGSLRKRGMHVPPWRRNAYMLAKWFGSYKRSTTPVPATKVELHGGAAASSKGLVGVEMFYGKNVYCRGEMIIKVGFDLGGGELKADLSGMRL